MRLHAEMQREYADLHATCTTEKAARAKRLMEVSAHRVEKSAQKKRIKESTQRLVEERSVQRMSVAEKRHTVDTVALKEKLT